MVSLRRVYFTVVTLGLLAMISLNGNFVSWRHVLNNSGITLDLFPKSTKFKEIAYHSFVKEKCGQIWVIHDDVSLESRLSVLNQVIAQLRLKKLSYNLNVEWPSNSTKVVVHYDARKLLAQLVNHSDTLTSVYLQYTGMPLDENWNSRQPQMRSNLLLSDYFDWSASAPLCRWLRNKKYGFLHSSPCIKGNSSGHELTKPVSLSVFYFSYQMTGGLNLPYVTFLHVIQHGTVTAAGDVFGLGYKIVLPSCAKDGDRRPPHFDRQLYCREVFVIGQPWGAGYFHKMFENLPRLAPYLVFLRRHSDVRIHMVTRNRHTDYLFSALGLDPNRIVTGAVHGSVVYLPRSSPCGHLLINEGQILNNEFRSFIRRNLTTEDDWNSIVLIQRSRNRRFVNMHRIIHVVKTLASKHDFEFEIFRDNPPPSAEETMKMFYNARIIIGPHGAGLTNMLFARPGTFIIEGICRFPDTNVCFLMGAYHLGHLYHGIPSLQGCEDGIKVDSQEIATVLDRFLTSIRPATLAA